MERIITYNLNENFIAKLANFVEENFIKKGTDLSRLAFVFEGKRPSLFLMKALAKKMKRSFFSPRFFSIDEFIDYLLLKQVPFAKMSNMESCYTIYTIAQDMAPEIIKGREEFSQFLPWAREISNFIDSLDSEDVRDDALKNLQASAAIGYDIPENINTSLKNIIAIRNAYHRIAAEKKSFPEGYTYLQAAEAVKNVNFDEFEKIIFCGFFYIQKTERKIIKHFYNTGKAILFFQGNEAEWQPLKDIAQEFSCSIKPEKKKEENYSLHLYSAFDRHSQVCTVREILKEVEKPEATVIVLPDAESMIPLVSEIGSSAGDFNVSLGYPLRRSSLYSLFEFIIQAQNTRRNGEYYVKDYLIAISQPLVKNLRILADYSATRVLVHKIEEALLGMERTAISGSLFIKLEDIEQDAILFEVAAKTLKHMDIIVSPGELQDIVKKLHRYLFAAWEKITNFHNFAISLGNLLDILLKKSFIKNYGLNLKIAESIYSLKDKFQNASISREEFLKEDLFKIFKNILENELAAFSGSPLKGLQILGMLETRALNFENVIVIDANESILPKLHTQGSLIPYEVALNLGLDREKNEEDIQRYNFTRLISAAKNVHIVYEENSKKEKSRFVERIIWEAQKKERKLDAAININGVSFSLNLRQDRKEIKKTEEMLTFLKNRVYSASSINTYLQCPLQFYYKYVLGFKEKEEFQDEPEGADIGTFLHRLLEETFKKFIGKKPKIDAEFRLYFFEKFNQKFEDTFGRKMGSRSFLLKDVMRRRLEQFLKSENERDIQKILYLEKKLSGEVEFSEDKFKFTYIIDRVDKLEDGSTLILDYKSGSEMLKPQKINKLEWMEFNRESIKDNIRSFQMPLYYYFENKKYEGVSLNAALYSLRNFKLAYLHQGKDDIRESMNIWMKALEFILHEIIASDKPFVADDEKGRICTYCPFFYLCR